MASCSNRAWHERSSHWRHATTTTTCDALRVIRRLNACPHRPHLSRKPGVACTRTPTRRRPFWWRRSRCHRRSGCGRAPSHVNQGATSVSAAPSQSPSLTVQTTTCRPALSPSARSGWRCTGTAGASSTWGSSRVGHVVCGDPTTRCAKRAVRAGCCITSWFARIGRTDRRELTNAAPNSLGRCSGGVWNTTLHPVPLFFYPVRPQRLLVEWCRNYCSVLRNLEK